MSVLNNILLLVLTESVFFFAVSWMKKRSRRSSWYAAHVWASRELVRATPSVEGFATREAASSLNDVARGAAARTEPTQSAAPTR